MKNYRIHQGHVILFFFWTAVLNVMLYVVVSRILDKHLQVRICIYIVALHINRESSPKLKWQTLLGSKNRGAELVWCNAQQKHLLQKLLRLLCLSSTCTKFHSKKTSQLAERLLSLFRFGICIHQSTIADDCWAHLCKTFTQSSVFDVSIGESSCSKMSPTQAHVASRPKPPPLLPHLLSLQMLSSRSW